MASDRLRRRRRSLDPDVVAGLEAALGTPAGGDPELLARVKAKLIASIAEERRQASHVTLRADEGRWEALAPGLTRKLLYERDGVVSALLRLAPGVVVPGHVHPVDEECLVLEGSLCIGAELVLRAGDFHVGRRGVPHADASTTEGALVYLRGAG